MTTGTSIPGHQPSDGPEPRASAARKILLVATVVLAIGLLGGCGSSASSGSASGSQASSAPTATTQTTHFAKTKFVIHAGLAFGAIYRYVYKPYKQGAFSGGLLHHKLATLKAALAVAFAYHETRLALDDARSSRILSSLLAPVLALQTKLSSLEAQLRGGTADGAAISSLKSDTQKISALSAAHGQPIQALAPSQL